MVKEPPAILRGDDGAQREVDGSGCVGSNADRLVDGSDVRGEGDRVMKVCGFNSWVDDGFVSEMGKTDGEASLVRKKSYVLS